MLFSLNFERGTFANIKGNNSCKGIILESMSEMNKWCIGENCLDNLISSAGH